MGQVESGVPRTMRIRPEFSHRRYSDANVILCIPGVLTRGDTLFNHQGASSNAAPNNGQVRAAVCVVASSEMRTHNSLVTVQVNKEHGYKAHLCRL
jgi:hypothetical protein